MVSRSVGSRFADPVRPLVTRRQTLGIRRVTAGADTVTQAVRVAMNIPAAAATKTSHLVVNVPYCATSSSSANCAAE
jgi:hypothetical protein